MPRRRVELHEATGELKVIFEYDGALVEQLRAIPRRRYEKAARAWFVAVECAVPLLEILTLWDFEIPDTIRALAQREGHNAQVRRVQRAVRRDSLTPSQINLRLRHLVRDSFQEIWIVGEISGWKPSRGRAAWCELIERDPWGGLEPKARVKTVIFEEQLARLHTVLQDLKPPLTMADGLQVRVLARVEVNERSGTYQLQLRDIDPYYSISALAQQREQVLEALDDLGISEQNVTLPMPPVPLRVGLITSVGSDAFHDFTTELKQSSFGFLVRVYDARMQGAKLETTVLRALRYFEAHQDKVDVVAIVRGGGARTELMQFDTLTIGKAVCELPVPLLCGIGHQQDHSLLDDLARSFKTPTAVAQALVAQVQTFVQELQELEASVFPEAARQVEAQRQTLLALASRIGREAGHRVEGQAHGLEMLGSAVARASREQVRAGTRVLDVLGGRLSGGVWRRLSETRQRLAAVQERLAPARLARSLGRQKLALDDLQGRLTRRVGRQLGQAREIEALERRLMRVKGRTRVEGRTLDDLEERLGRVGQRTRAQGRMLDDLGERLGRVRGRMRGEGRGLDELAERLGRAALRAVRREKEGLEGLEGRCEALDPVRVLERGFALVINENGQIVREAGEVAQGAALRVRVAQGMFEATRTDRPEPKSDALGLKNIQPNGALNYE